MQEEHVIDAYRPTSCEVSLAEANVIATENVLRIDDAALESAGIPNQRKCDQTILRAMLRRSQSLVSVVTDAMN